MKLKNFFVTLCFVVFYSCTNVGKIDISVNEGTRLYFYNFPSNDSISKSSKLPDTKKNFYLDSISLIEKIFGELNFNEEKVHTVGDSYFVQLVQKNNVVISMLYLSDYQSFRLGNRLAYFNIDTTSWFVNALKKTNVYHVKIWGVENARGLYTKLGVLGAFVPTDKLPNGDNPLFVYNYEANLVVTRRDRNSSPRVFFDEEVTKIEKKESITVVTAKLSPNSDTLKIKIYAEKNDVSKIPQNYRIITGFRKIQFFEYYVL